MVKASESKQISKNKRNKRWYNGSKTIFTVAVATLPFALNTSDGGPPTLELWATVIAYVAIVVPVVVMMYIKENNKGKPGVTSVRRPAILVVAVASTFGFIPPYFLRGAPPAILVLAGLIGGIAAAWAANRLPDLEETRVEDSADPKSPGGDAENNNAEAMNEPVSHELQGSDFLSKRDYLIIFALLVLLFFWRRKQQ